MHVVVRIFIFRRTVTLDHQRGHSEAVGARLMEGIGLNELELVSGEAEQQANNIHRDITLCEEYDHLVR